MSHHCDPTPDKNWPNPHEFGGLPLRPASGEKVGLHAQLIPEKPTKIPLIPFSCACRTLPYLHGGEEDSSSESDSDFDGGPETSEGELTGPNDLWERCDLALGHKYQYARPNLTQRVYNQFCDWKTSVQYAIPPGHRQPSRKRVGGTARKLPVFYLYDEDPLEPDAVILSRISGYFHLACPFYRYDPVRYCQCMRAHDLQSIEDVIVHLQRHHRLPAHCPICLSIFSDARVRDAHVRGRTCELQPETKIEGIDSRKMSKILRRDDPYVREDIRWLRIFQRVFPTRPTNHSPYLTGGAEFEISLVRDYVSGDGRSCILECIQGCGLLEGGEDKNELAMFYSLAVEDLIEKVLHSHMG